MNHPVNPHETIARLRGELGVMAELLGQCLEVVLTVEADGSSESAMLQQLIQDSRNALTHVRSTAAITEVAQQQAVQVDPVKLTQLEKFVAWEKQQSPGLTHIAEWAIRTIKELNTARRQVETEPPLLAEIGAEVERAMQKFPTWPTDPLHALAVLGEEFGELTKDVLQLTYEPHKTNAENVRKEATQTAAMALRFLASLDAYEYRRCLQHNQDTLQTAETIK